MRLLFFDFEIPELLKDEGVEVGGACVRQYAFNMGLTALGHKVGILTWKGTREYLGEDLVSAAGFDIVESYPRSGGIRKLRWLSRFPSLYKAVKAFKPDFILQKCIGSSTGILAFVGILLKTPFVYMAANDIDADSRARKALSAREYRMYKFGLRHASHIVCQNNYQRLTFKNQFPHKKIGVVANPFYTTHVFFPIKDRSERMYVAWAGTFNRKKNLPLLLQIARECPDLRFRIAGKESSRIDEDTRSAVSELRKLANVEFVGYLKRQEIMRFMADASVLLNTSDHEGFSNTYLEAWAVGTPVVAHAGVDPDHIISRFHLGKSVDHPSGLSKALVEIIDDKNFNILAENCRRYLFENHDYRRKSEELVEILRKDEDR